LGKAQTERELLLMEMVKEEIDFVIKREDHMTEASIYGCITVE